MDNTGNQKVTFILFFRTFSEPTKQKFYWMRWKQWQICILMVCIGLGIIIIIITITIVIINITVIISILKIITAIIIIVLQIQSPAECLVSFWKFEWILNLLMLAVNINLAIT